VILLGIGFIMIAGIFPVAIQQTAAVSSETQGSAVIRDAIKKIQAVANAPSGFPPAAAGSSNSLFQPTGTAAVPIVQAFSPNIMQALGSDSFFSADRRFGWVGFYRRDSATSPFAQVFVIALQNPNFPNYVTKFAPGEVTAIPAGSIPPVVAPPIPPALYNYASPGSPYAAPAVPPATPSLGVAASISAQFIYNTDASWTVALTYPTSQTSFNGTTGAFVILAASSGTNPAPPNLIGRIFRLAAVPPNTSVSAASMQTFYLQPGYDLTPAEAIEYGFSANGSTAFTGTVFLIGAAPMPDTTGGFTGPFTGPNQDIAAGSAFIRVNTSNN